MEKDILKMQKDFLKYIHENIYVSEFLKIERKLLQNVFT